MCFNIGITKTIVFPFGTTGKLTILGVPILKQIRVFIILSYQIKGHAVYFSVGSERLVGCFGFNGPLRQYFSLYRAVSQREGEREEKG